jgi:hypothetical protein
MKRKMKMKQLSKRSLGFGIVACLSLAMLATGGGK